MRDGDEVLREAVEHRVQAAGRELGRGGRNEWRPFPRAVEPRHAERTQAAVLVGAAGRAVHAHAQPAGVLDGCEPDASSGRVQKRVAPEKD